jgi:hypothetical protein
MMTVTLNDFAPMYGKMVDTAAHLLAKGKAFAAENGVAEADMLNWRLAEDMNPLSFQLAVVINFATGWLARAAGVDAPEAVIGAEQDVAGFERALAAARAYIDGPVSNLTGRDDVPVTFKIGDIMEPTLPAGQWITGFATTNIYFHVSMIYAILRMKGVQVGKLDMFPKGL